MKKIICIFILGIFVYSCSTTKNNTVANLSKSDTKSDTLRIANDSLEYEIMIIEPGFNGWLVTQRPRSYYSTEFLEIRNLQYVTTYNQRVLQPQQYDPNIYMQTINYQIGTKYGHEVNYLLYNYFLYFEKTFKQRFSNSRR